MIIKQIKDVYNFRKTIQEIEKYIFFQIVYKLIETIMSGRYMRKHVSL